MYSRRKSNHIIQITSQIRFLLSSSLSTFIFVAYLHPTCIFDLTIRAEFTMEINFMVKELIYLTQDMSHHDYNADFETEEQSEDVPDQNCEADDEKSDMENQYYIFV